MLKVNFAKVDFYGKLFAAGALMGTAFCIVLLEAGRYVESNGALEEAEAQGHWAAMVLAGFLTPLIVELFSKAIYSWAISEHPIAPNGIPVADASPTSVPHESSQTKRCTGEESGDSKSMVVKEEGLPPLEIDLSDIKRQRAVEQSYADSTARTRLVYAVLVGDFFHNFCDGIFIGAAFKSCSVSFGWTVASITISHEVVQELADFLVLARAARLPHAQVLMLNAAAGLSVIFGGIAIASADISEYAVGMLLAFGAGQYIYTAAVELMPTFNDSHHDLLDHLGHSMVLEAQAQIGAGMGESSRGTRVSIWDKAVGLAVFVVGAAAVGLVLLNHTHCEAGEGGAEGAAGGHNH